MIIPLNFKKAYPETDRIKIVDLETTIKNVGDDAVGTMKASPFNPNNFVVYAGDIDIYIGPYSSRSVTSMLTNNGVFGYIKESGRRDGHPEIIDYEEGLLIVGHNIKFDLLYLLVQKATTTSDLVNMYIWDTMVVEYLLTGQNVKYASLDKLSIKYGGTVKDSKIKEYWNNGVQTEDIPDHEIVEYLEEDCKNTALIFEKQIAKADELNMYPLIKSQMAALTATTIMEYHGMHFDIKLALDKAREIMERVKELQHHIEQQMITLGIHDPNINSNEHISLLLFGGTQKVEFQVPWMKDGEHIVYKTGPKAGQPRYRKEERLFHIPRTNTPDPNWTTKKNGVYKVDDSVLKELGHTLLIEYRTLNKDLTTYYVGFSKLFWPHDDCIHGTINHTATGTGRLSSSNPNLQNLTNKE